MASLSSGSQRFLSSRQRRWWWRSARLFWAMVLVVLIGYIPVRLAIAHLITPTPQLVLSLGGRPAREAVAAELAANHPELKVWVSSGLSPEAARSVFHAVGISEERYRLDYRAVDTVTNFTTLVDDLNRQQIHHIYLVTSDYHMPRARAIAAIVLGSRGITTTAVAVPSAHPPESQLRTVRDILRSIFWIFTGQTGAQLNCFKN